MKNVFFFRHYATPPDLPGGRRHFNTALLMTRSGFQTYMFTSNFRHVPKKYAKTFKGMHLIEDYEGVKYVWINNRPPYLKNDWRRLLGMLDYSFKSVVTAWRLKRQGIKPDLIIGSVAHLFAVLAAYIAALLLGAEFWMDIGDLWPEAYVRGGTLKPGNPITIVMSVMSNFLYKRAKKIVVLTENTRKYLVGLGISAEKIIVFGNGALLDPEDKNRAGLERPGGTFTLTYAGSFGDLYPLEELVEAVDALNAKGRKINVLIFGDGWKRDMLTETIRKKSLDNIKMPGYIDKGELWDNFAQSHALIALEKNVAYGFPNKLIDYSLSGRPVILASGGEYDLPADIYLKTRPTPEQIGAVIEKVMDMSDGEWKRKGEAVYKFAVENFDMRNNFDLRILPLLSALPQTHVGIFSAFVKRTIDLVMVTTALVVLSPVLIAVSIIIRLKMGSPILFRQDRPGLHEKTFKLYKFRTMTEDRDENGKLLPDKDRLTPLGRLLRSFSLDELPQLINVLRGDMSIVGPRPLLVKYLGRYTPHHARRHEMKPGITGSAQISGRHEKKLSERLDLDVWYIDNFSIWLDIKIIFSTVTKVIRREGYREQQEDVLLIDDVGLTDAYLESRSNKNKGDTDDQPTQKQQGGQP